VSEINVRNNLSAPHAGKDSPLYRMIASKAGTGVLCTASTVSTSGGRNGTVERDNTNGTMVRGNTSLADGAVQRDNLMHADSALPSCSPFDYSTLWSTQWWGLDASAVFAKFSSEQQAKVLSECNQSLLREAYFIEKSGLAYSAKMILMAKDTDEAQLFAFIGADEAKHLAWIEPYVQAAHKQMPRGHFLAFLSSLIEEYPPRLLVYLVQVILEGWGLDHYNRLAKSCSHPDLAAIFASILKDEALHHRSGVVLFDACQLSSRDLSMIEDALQQYTMMVRVGPQSALAIVNEVACGLTETELQEVLIALRHEEETLRKLKLLRTLMKQPQVDQLVEILDAERCFLPASLPEAVDCYLSSR
jgi:hypothetical protein